METPSRRSPASQLPDVERLALTATLFASVAEDADLRAALETVGYDASRIDAGRALLSAAQAAHDASVAAAGRQREATEAQKAAYSTARERFTPLLAQARVGFRVQPATLAALGAKGGVQRSAAPFIAQGRQFTQAAADADRAAVLARVGVTPQHLSDLTATLDAFEQARQAADARQAEAQDATAARRAALNALDAYLRDLRALARVALRQRPQLLEKLGIRA